MSKVSGTAPCSPTPRRSTTSAGACGAPPLGEVFDVARPPQETLVADQAAMDALTLLSEDAQRKLDELATTLPKQLAAQDQRSEEAQAS